MHRHDMRDRAFQDRETGRIEPGFQGRGAFLVLLAQMMGGFEVFHAGARAGRQGRRQGRGEDEAGRHGADGVTDRAIGRDIAAHHAERLAQRTLDDVNAVHDPVALGNAGAPQAVEADRMDFVQIGQRAILVGQVADLLDRADIAIHGIDRLKGDHLGRIGRSRSQQFFQMLDIIMAPDPLLAARALHALDHRGVVQLVGENDQARQDFRQGRERRLIGDIAGGEEQCAILAVQVGERALQLDMVMRGAGNIARAAGAGADIINGLLHRFHDTGHLAHAEIVIGTPDRHIAHIAARRTPAGHRETALATQQVGKHTVAAFSFHAADSIFESALVVHRRGLSSDVCQISISDSTV